MKTKRSTKGFWIFIILMIPTLTILTALGGAKLMLSGALSESKQNYLVYVGIGIVAMVLSMFGAFRAKQKKFVWGMAYAAGYIAVLMLSNLLFFGEGYGEIIPNIIAVMTGGVIGSILGGGKRRKAKHA